MWGAILWLFVAVITPSPGWGMMGGHGGMMDGGRTLGAWIGRVLGPWLGQSRSEAGQEEGLRQRIREKRRELSRLLRAENPDRDRIDQTIEELDTLESELDRRTGWK